MKMLLVLFLSSLPASSAWAIFPNPHAKADAKRFAAYHGRRNRNNEFEANIDKAVYDFNHKRGLKPAKEGTAFTRGGITPQARAEEFLNESSQRTGIDPSTLSLERNSGAQGHKHLLFRQNFKGLPVEFSYVKVHLADNGAVLSVDAKYDKKINLNPIPAISASQAEGFVKQSGAKATDEGALLILPDPTGGPARLAWRFLASAQGGKWRYYVDADTGVILFRHLLVRNACGTSGNMSAMIYDVTPLNGPTQIRPLAHMRVYQGDQNTFADTDTNGNYCGAGIGKIFTQFQGPYVRVSDFNGPSAHYDNGSGVWSTVATPLSSPHPYPLNSVITSTIDLRGVVPPSAVEFLPVFNNFNVGEIDSVNGFGEGGELAVDDQLAILDGAGSPVGSYIGMGPNQLGILNGAAVPGQVMYLQLKSGGTRGTGTGFDVVVSSYLTLSNQYLANGNAATQSLVWVATDTYIGLRSEFNLFYHLNLMHDFFMFGTGTNGVSLYGNDNSGNQLGGVDISSQAFIGNPMHALSLVGPDISNPFYDPEYDDIIFGDVSALSPTDYLTDDATVPHHEYTHYVVEKIWSFPNFGEAGAISEADADYFSASSLNDPSIGTYVVQSFGDGTFPIRELDSTVAANDLCGATPAVLSNSSWQGEIHCDGRFISQSDWDLRKARISLQGAGPGQACVDGLVFQSLLFFPESFDEYEKAMIKVDALGLVPACAVPASVCGGNPIGCVGAPTISATFGTHGVTSVGGTNDAYDTSVNRNDGFETAVDVATIPAVSATIYPAGDLDFYTFPAGIGPITLTLNLPPDAANPGEYKGYMMTLYDRQHHQVGQIIPTMDGTNTIGGACAVSDCDTSQNSVTLSYYNPSAGQMFVEIAGAFTNSGGSNSGVNSLNQYTVSFQYVPTGAIYGSVVTAAYDNDTIAFNVFVTTWLFHQDFNFAYAQLRDQTLAIIPNTLTHATAQAGDWLAFVSSVNTQGSVSGTLQLQKGFASRFPSLGTVSLEVFGYDTYGSTVSLGRSLPFNLTANETALTAYNNVFNPSMGQAATIQYAIQTPGHVTLRLYSQNGRFITTLLDEDEPAGKGAINWGGTNVNGRIIASGVYILYMVGPNIATHQKIVVVK